MVVSDGLHQNAGCAEQPLVLGLKIDRKAGQLPGVEETTHSGDTLSTHESRPFKDTGRRRVRRPRPVRCPLAAPGRPEVEVRVHYPFVKLAVSLTTSRPRSRAYPRPCRAAAHYRNPQNIKQIQQESG